MKYNNLDDVMKDLTFLKNISDGHDQFDMKLNAIADMLALFNIKWKFEECDERFIAKLDYFHTVERRRK